MATVSVRYIVRDVDDAISFYRDQLAFTEVMQPAPSFARLQKSDLRPVLSAPGGGPGGGQTMPDGTLPAPGGWNQFAREVADLAATVAQLRASGVRFRNDIVAGVGGRQIIVEDPSGNLVELFESILDEARLSSRSSEAAAPNTRRSRFETASARSDDGDICVGARRRAWRVVLPRRQANARGCRA